MWRRRRPILRHFTTAAASACALKPQIPIAIQSARELHAYLIRNGLHSNPSSPISDVLRSYALTPHNLAKTRFVFAQIQNPTILTYNWLIHAITHSDQPIEAILLYDQMRVQCKPNKITFIYAFKACGRVPNIVHGRRIHGHCLKHGFSSYLFVGNGLIRMYGACGDLGLARKVFDELPERDLVSWNSLICGYSQQGVFGEVLGLFRAMRAERVRADAVTMVKVLLACGHLGDQGFADSSVEYIEGNNVEVDVYLGNTLIDFYGRRCRVELARKVFDQMPERNVVSWNAMVMVYAKVGDLLLARKVFDEIPVRDVISWTTMINGYCQGKRFLDALMLFREMMVAKVRPDEITIASVLSACAHVGQLDIGKAVHNYIASHNISFDIYVSNSLIDMYCKCGNIEKAMEVFRDMKEKDSVSWTAIIVGLAVNGLANDALEHFSQMLKAGVRASDVTFIGVLLACSHAGMVDQGLEHFRRMTVVHKIEPMMKHYGCVVDLLSRSGHLNRAYEFIEKMPVAPDPVLWRILLSACKLHENVILAEVALKKLLQLDPNNSGNYVLLSNAYASADRWNDSEKSRNLMTEFGVEKEPGCSSIEANGSLPESVAQNNKLPFLKDYRALTAELP
ncbi:hypothetical protein Sjap_001976 [Stephania japonica]|uniref:Uncharacterized protein n=1 Tax=Stephania japonica TaxID=461633 RepID=A0AAP0PVL9_9MAGN